MSLLFQAMRINRMELKNRFVRSATMDTLAEGGKVTDALLQVYRELAMGEVGLIITGGMYVGEDGRITPGQLAADSDEMIPSLSALASVVHQNGGKVAAQLFHCGWNARPQVTGNHPVGPSPMVNPRLDLKARELSGDEIEKLIEQFSRGARRVMEAGLDGVQLHAAHGWLPSAFLSPAANRREDEWGGSPEKRATFVRRICRGMRDSVGPDFPVMIKLGLKDYHPDGKPLSEGIDTAKALEADGIDAIEVSEGFEKEHAHHIRIDATAPYYLEECRAARQVLSIPLILVGGMRKPADMQQVLDDHIADAVSLCRPLIMDPHLVRKLREASTHESECISCNGCLVLSPGERFRCVVL